MSDSAPAPDASLPTQQEQRSYNSFVGSLINPILNQRAVSAPKTLWHYTTGSTLIKIIESATVWSTHVACLNDQTEYEYARELARSALERLKKTGDPNDDARALVERLEGGLQGEAASTSEWFVLSFSETRDDLSQWRAYSGGEGGYSVGFDTRELAASAARDRAYLFPVIYDVAQQNEIADKLIVGTLIFYMEGLKSRTGKARDTWMANFITAWEREVTYFAPMVKHPAFRQEQEWRIVRQLRDADFPNMTYQQRASLMSRHLPLRFPRENSSLGALPITEIMIGPTRNKRVSQVSVGDLIRTHDYPANSINITLSAAPFQSP